MGHKTRGITSQDRRRFVLFWTLGCALIFTLSAILTHRVSITLTSLDGHLVTFIELGAIFTTFGFLQRSLIRRYLHLDMRHWVRWTWFGVMVGYVCHSLFTAVAASPVPVWLQLYYGEEPSKFADLLYVAYHSLRLSFLFGFPILFQWFALPKTFSFRWIWLLTAFITGPVTYMVMADGFLFNLVRVIEGLMGGESIEILRPVILLDLLTPIAIPAIVLAWLATLADKRGHLAESN